MLAMIRKIERPDRNVDLEAIARRNNEGGASESLKRRANRPWLYDAVDFQLCHRQQELAGSVADTPVNVSHDDGENGLARFDLP
jgi:hypothetical protein